MKGFIVSSPANTERLWFATHETWGDESWHFAKTKAEAKRQADEYTRRNPAQGKTIKIVPVTGIFNSERYENGFRVELP